MRLRNLRWIIGGLIAILVLSRGPTGMLNPFEAGPMPAAAAQASEGQRLLEQLVEGARKEGQLNVFLTSSQRERGVKELNQAFNRRFELNVKFNVTLASITRNFAKVVEELKIGLTPSHDVMYLSEGFLFPLLQIGGIARIDNWEALLKEISPEAYQVRDKISPLDMAGYAFAWGNRVKGINYNTDLIS